MTVEHQLGPAVMIVQEFICVVSSPRKVCRVSGVGGVNS